jgi:hypothetical protein
MSFLDKLVENSIANMIWSSVLFSKDSLMSVQLVPNKKKFQKLTAQIDKTFFGDKFTLTWRCQNIENCCGGYFVPKYGCEVIGGG